MRVALGQMECVVGDRAANGERMASLINEAAGKGCDLIVFPEMADTGYEMKTIKRLASSFEDGPCRDLCAQARRSGIAVVCGLSQREGDQVFNAAAAIDGRGTLVACYRKMHLFSLINEQVHLGRGDRLVTVPLAGFTLGLMICYDLRFPELARSLALMGADVLVVVAAWPQSRIKHWKLLNTARAIENQSFVIAVNRAGRDGDMNFGGDSRLIGPDGSLLASTTGSGPESPIGELDRALLDGVRTGMRVFDDRRPDLYRT